MARSHYTDGHGRYRHRLQRSSRSTDLHREITRISRTATQLFPDVYIDSVEISRAFFKVLTEVPRLCWYVRVLKVELRAPKSGQWYDPIDKDLSCILDILHRNYFDDKKLRYCDPDHRDFQGLKIRAVGLQSGPMHWTSRDPKLLTFVETLIDSETLQYIKLIGFSTVPQDLIIKCMSTKRLRTMILHLKSFEPVAKWNWRVQFHDHERILCFDK